VKVILLPFTVYRLLFTVFIAVYCLLLTPAFGGDAPFDGPANWGGTGLMETPTARVLREGRFRIGVSQMEPYRYYYGVVSPLKGLEVGGRVTEVRGVPALTANYGNFKDKAVDLKYQFVSEGKYHPAIALGIMDPHGTRVYPSQYLVMSKQIYPFDFTVGYGNGRFGKTPLTSGGEKFKAEIFSSPRDWWSDSQVFGGIQFAPSESFLLMAEYSPIKYESQTGDPAQRAYFREPVSSKFNFGIRWRPLDWTEVDLSYQRGDQIGINVSFAFELGNPLVPIYVHPYKEKPEFKTNPLTKRLVRALSESGFSNIGVMETDDELWIEAENDRYYYTPRAIAVILKIVNDIAPANIQKVHLILAENGVPDVEFTTTKEDVAEYFAGRLSYPQLYRLSKIHTDIYEPLKVKKEFRKFFDFGIRPDFQTFLNDPSGFFKYRLGASAWTSYRPWSGASLVGGIAAYPLNNVSTTNEPLSRPVRTDIVPYLEDRVALERVMFEQIGKMKHEVYGRLSGGLLEVEYGGVDGELAMPLFGGRIMIGLSGSLVRKRDPGSPLALKKDDWKDYYTTGFVNGRLNIPEQEVTLDVKAGQFLAGDRGARFTISKFFNGVILSAWYSMTDTSIFTDGFNNGYHDKGIGISFPLRIFSGTDSRTTYSYRLSPWTRDVAQDINHFTNLFDYIGRKIGVYLEKDTKQ